MSEQVVGVTTRYYGATDHRGSRIRVQWGNERAWMPFDYAPRDPHVHAVEGAMAKWGREVGSVQYVTESESGRGSVYRVVLSN